MPKGNKEKQIRILKKIQKYARAIRKENPGMPQKEAVKQAGAMYREKKKK